MIEKLLKLLKIKFAGEIPLKDGTMIRVDGDVVVGASVYVQSPDGEIPLPSGDYELETGEILTTKDGKIEAISSPVDTTQEPDINGNPPVGEITVEVDGTKLADLPVVDTTIPTDKPKDIPMMPMDEVKTLIDELTKRVDDLESKLKVKAEVEAELRTELDFIKTKTLVTELRKSKDVDDIKPLSRIEIIKNLKNNK